MPNFNKVFAVFENNYSLVPLEVFGNDPYKTLVSTLMSSRTNDDTTLVAAKKLFKAAPDIRELNDLDISTIGDLIYPVGFYKTKAYHLKKLANIIVDEFGGKIPNNRKGLMSLPGVGRKTANLVLNRAFGKPAIAVDTHVHRICNILGWVKTNTPEQTEKSLMIVLPKRYWSKTNRLFVSIGRQYRSARQLKDFLQQQGLLS